MAMFTMVGVRRAVGCGALLLVALAGCAQQPKNDPGAGNPVTSTSSEPTPAVSSAAPVPDRQPHTLVLEATGGGRVTSMKYTLDGQEVERGAVTLPWRESITIPADGQPHSYVLEVEFSGGGRVNLVAIFNGQVVAQGGSAATGGGQGSAAVGGSVNG